jgi:hypothetical protein
MTIAIPHHARWKPRVPRSPAIVTVPADAAPSRARHVSTTRTPNEIAHATTTDA